MTRGTQGPAPGRDAGEAPGLELRELATMDDLRPLEAIQRTVWGVDDLEVVPASAMRAAVHAGGLVVGAHLESETVGFAFGFVASPHGSGMSGPGLHSHMAAVTPALQGRGIGRRLKAYQAAWCRAHGLSWVSWTFDPLRARNARFNLEVLGALCYDYLPDFYGPMPGTLGGGLESDRLLAVWEVARGADGSPDAADASGPTRGAGDPAPETWLLPVADRPAPAPAAEVDAATASGARLRVAAPSPDRDVFSRPALAMEWRAAHRRTLLVALGRGYVVTGFSDGAYELLPRSGRPSEPPVQHL